MQAGRTIMWAGLAAAAGSLCGCGQPLFPDDLPRSPYERYQVLHGQPQTQAAGTGLRDMTPEDLRDRLSPLEPR